MFVSLKWLSDYIELDLSPADIAHKLTQAGTEAVGIERHNMWGDYVVVGEVKQVRKHPQADRLSLVTVEYGADEPQEVVCGAPNVAAGQKIAFAKTGAELMDSHNKGAKAVLKPTKIRGVVSRGMVCSELELGLSDNHETILELDKTLEVGTRLEKMYGDVVLELEPTPNRPDCFSMLGVARELGAITGVPLKLPQIKDGLDEETGSPAATIKIDSPELCRRFTGAVVEGVKIAPSPAWLANRLLMAGERPINNIVDISNFVMLEYGQPLHAFDLRHIADATIVVRRAKDGEKLTTLDGVERKLNSNMLVIADPRHAVALAGIMGGADSMVADDTSSVLLEVANFNGESIRNTSRAVNLRSEASLRFEKGLNPELARHASRRALGLIVDICGGKVVPGYGDNYPAKQPPKTVFVNFGAPNKLLGHSFDKKSSARVLSYLGFEPRERDDGWEVTVPYWRTDIAQSADLCEEIARIRGYDQIPAAPLGGALTTAVPDPFIGFKERLRDICAGDGLYETISYSALAEGNEDGLLENGATAVKLVNPVSADFAVMRRSLRATSLKNLNLNLRVTRDPIALFECGKVYEQRDGEVAESWQLGCVIGGSSYTPLAWHDTSRKADFYDIKGVAEGILDKLGVAQPVFVASGADPFYCAGRAAVVKVRDKPIGMVGEIKPELVEGGSGAAYLELFLEPLFKLIGKTEYVPIPRLPGAYRDFSLVLDKAIEAGVITDAIKTHKLVASATVFDMFDGQSVAPDKKVLAVRTVLRSPKRTLDAKSIRAVETQILNQLRQKFGAILRE